MSQLEAGRVTAGLPSLNPFLRFAHDKKELRQERDRVMDYEIASKRDAAVAPDGDRPRTEYQACVGIPLHSSELIRRLSVLNPALWFQRHPDRPIMQIWMRGDEGKRFVCGFEAEYSPEFEVILCHEEEHVEGRGPDARLVKVKVADDTVRGWRTVMAKLIKQKILTKAGAERMFGSVNSYSWQAHTGGY